MSLNEVKLIGWVKDEPVVRMTTGEKDVLDVILITDDSYVRRGDQRRVERLERHRLVFWGDLAKKATAIAQGELIYVDGRLTTREWKAANGERRVTTEVIVNHFLRFNVRSPLDRRVDDVPKDR